MAKRKAGIKQAPTVARAAELSRRGDPASIKRRTLQRLIPMLLIAVGLAAYQNSFGGAFFLDDHTAIRDNPHIGELWPPWAWQPRGESTVAFRRLSIRNTFRVGDRIATLVIVVAVLMYVTVRRNEDYRSELSILLDTVAKRPNNARAHSNAGTVLFRQGRLAEAFPHFANAVRFKPDFPEARNNLGALLYERGQLEEARGHLSEALRLRPAYADAHANLGAVLQQQGQIADAVVHYSEAIRLKPTHALAHSNLGLAFMTQGKVDDAARQFETALKLDPNRRDTRRALDELKRSANRSGPTTR